jgi:hypothetical protein
MKAKKTTNPQQNQILWFISPPFITLVSGAIALLCSFIPRPLYREMVEEPFYFFAHIPALLFITFCILSFLSGYFVFGLHATTSSIP